MAEPYVGYAAASILCLTCSTCYFDYLRKKRQNENSHPDLILITQEQFDNMNSIIKIQPENNVNVNYPPPKYKKNENEVEVKVEAEAKAETMKTPLLPNEYTTGLDDYYVDSQNSIKNKN